MLTDARKKKQEKIKQKKQQQQKKKQKVKDREMFCFVLFSKIQRQSWRMAQEKQQLNFERIACKKGTTDG